jgi:type IV pilus assembly protein PilY1
MQLTAYYGGGVYRLVHNPADFRTALYDILQALLKRASAGAAASVLASGEGSGANIVQAVFYPKRKFSLLTPSGVSISSEIRWTGRLSNFWYYVDPFFKASSIYEDSASAKVLDLRNDNKITFYYDPALEQTKGDARLGIAITTGCRTLYWELSFEDLSVLAGSRLVLFKRDASRERFIQRQTARTFRAAGGGFHPNNAGSLFAHLNPQDLDKSGTIDAADASVLIRYVRGEDFPLLGLRSRTVPIDLNGNGQLDAGETKVWKLGDILNSTPRISSKLPLNLYHDTYGDTAYANFISKDTNPDDYLKRQMVFAGGNDGMIHAFKLGSLELNWTGQNEHEKARLLPLRYGFA